MDPLRECPFCGAEAIYKIYGAANDLIMIMCSNPYGPCCSMSSVAVAKNVLIEKWNRRSADREIAALTSAVIDLSDGVIS